MHELNAPPHPTTLHHAFETTPHHTTKAAAAALPPQVCGGDARS